MEGFRVFSPAEWEAAGEDGTAMASTHLKATLEGLAKHLFGTPPSLPHWPMTSSTW